ncbi:hypothetical protein [Nonomuraea typhae]|uniref:hypothetical protein n=1 Tax=Nonomuraea typhae TaxID=2603600 RepID=UPI0012FBDED5|nr:hypothetical protein [Nonomuraea typhae]
MTVTRFQDLPLADREREWDAAAADKRVRRWAGAEDEPNEKFRRAFLWYDADDADEYGAYKLPIADVVNGELKAVPRAVMSAGGVLDGARGGVKIPEKEVDRVKGHLAKYYDKMGDVPPWDR